MVRAGVQLFFVVLSFSVVICSITNYCLSSKAGAEPPAHDHAGCGTPLGGCPYPGKYLFSCACGYRCGCAQIQGRWHAVYQRFLKREKPKQTILCLDFYFLVCTFHTGSDVAHILHA